MRKIDSKDENPIDNLNIYVADKISPFFKSLGFSPNGITTLSLLFGMLSIYFLYKDYNVWWFAIAYYISYFFDCMDGFYARKYSMVTKFGDAYDHIKDVTVTIGVLTVLYFKNRSCPSKVLWIVAAVFFLSLFLSMAHLGCQEKIYNKEGESDALLFTKNLCPGDPKESIKFLRYFGCGTFTLIVIGLVVYIESSRVCKG
jgi:phosphatidylglycerophosphate synthase